MDDLRAELDQIRHRLHIPGHHDDPGPDARDDHPQEGSDEMKFAEIEARVSEAVHAVVADLEAHEPAVEHAAAEMLHVAGAPPMVADAVAALLRSLRDHFESTKPAEAPAEHEAEHAAA